LLPAASAIFAATSASRPLADVSYCVHALARRLAKTHNWVVRRHCHVPESACIASSLFLPGASSTSTVMRNKIPTKTGQVALKTLIVIHRTLRDGDAAFREELLSYRRKGHALQMSNFKDGSSPLGHLSVRPASIPAC